MGIRTPANYTVEQCLKDWLETLNTQADSTVTGYRIMVRHLVELLGNVKLVELKVRDVDFALGKLAKRLSTRSVRLARMILIQATRNAMVNDLVFCTSRGGPMYATDVRMEFKRITEKAGLGQDWTPRELRHTFVSLLSDSGVPIEQIADAVGHASTRTTEVVYRHQLRPVTRTAAIALGPLFESRGKTNGGQS